MTVPGSLISEGIDQVVLVLLESDGGWSEWTICVITTIGSVGVIIGDFVQVGGVRWVCGVWKPKLCSIICGEVELVVSGVGSLEKTLPGFDDINFTTIAKIYYWKLKELNYLRVQSILRSPIEGISDLVVLQSIAHIIRPKEIGKYTIWDSESTACAWIQESLNTAALQIKVLSQSCCFDLADNIVVIWAQHSTGKVSCNDLHGADIAWKTEASQSQNLALWRTNVIADISYQRDASEVIKVALDIHALIGWAFGGIASLDNLQISTVFALKLIYWEKWKEK